MLGQPQARDLAATRMPWILAFMAFWALLILLRLVWVQVISHDRYQRRARNQHLTKVPVMAVRGELRDRHGASLAISTRAESLFCTPPTFYPDFRSAPSESEVVWGEPDRKAAAKVAQALAPILERSSRSIQEKLLRKKPFVYIERQLPPEKSGAVRDLKLEGVDFLPESRRQYPRGSLACQILGYTNIDGVGQLGIERTYNEPLAGVDGELVAPKDARGRLLMFEENYAKVPVNGTTLQLTLDATIQHIVEQALEEGVNTYHPLTAYAVVVDPNTGEILAMAGTPTFDPNYPVSKKFRNRPESEFSAAEKEEYRRELERQKAARKVHPVEDAYEPGSTMKIFTAAIALEEHKIHLGERIDCMGGKWRFSKDLTITDTHSHGLLTFEEVLWQSSNVGAAKMGLRLDRATHYQYLRKFGFGEPTGLNFPGETPGRLQAPDRWSAVTQPTLCYGYGLSTSPLQVLMAGCALANGGQLMRPLLVQKVYNDQGALLKEHRPEIRGQAVSHETSVMMREALKGVITQGTAKKAQLDGGVEAFGKTGTARKIIGGKYDPKRHYASFMGFFPADKPQYGMLFMLDEPTSGLTGGDVAAPLFKKIGDGIMRYRTTGRGLDQEPDLKLNLRDWPVSENDEAVVHVEVGKVPNVQGLTLKAAVNRIVMAGGVPRVESQGPPPDGPYVVLSQSPAPNERLEYGSSVRLKLRTP